MTAVDTNVLVRFLTRDDQAQFDAARAYIREAAESEAEIWISLPVLCELVWVLSQAYGYRRSEIADALDALVRSTCFVLQDEGEVATALQRFRNGNAGFSDYLIGELASKAGCTETVTFDRKLARAVGFRELAPRA